MTTVGGIVLCGGIGLQLGHAVLAPGMQSRGRKLKEAGREVARVLLGVALMLVLAAAIESYIRQSHLSQGARFWVAGLSAVLWGLYFYHGHIRERLAPASR